MIPPPPDPAERDQAGPADLAVGWARAFRPWLIAAVLLAAFVGVLLWGANRPDNPKVASGSGSAATKTAPGGVTSDTPADGLDFQEIARKVGEDCFKLLVADTPQKRASGLRYREQELDRVDGMLFVEDQPQAAGFFTMAGVTDPLQVGFYDARGNVIGGYEMKPCSGSVSACPRYVPQGAWTYAIETKPGKLPDGKLSGTCKP